MGNLPLKNLKRPSKTNWMNFFPSHNPNLFLKKGLIYKKSIFYRTKFLGGLVLFFSIQILLSFHTLAQSCGGGYGNTIFKETFGAGSGFGPALTVDNGDPLTNYANGATTYTYVDPSKGQFPNDNQYTIGSNPSLAKSDWANIKDHTGDPNGKMLIVNASYALGNFYRRTVSGLCKNTNFLFSAWFAEINSQGSFNICGTPLPSNVSFIVTDSLGNILDSTSTGKIYGVKSNTQWQNFSFPINTGNYTTINVILRNNAPGGCGNDLAIDDISLTPCGPKVTVAGPTGTVCAGNFVSFKATVGAGYTPPYYQWQVSTDGGKTFGDIGGANAAIYSINNVLITQNNYQYRVLVAGSADNVKNGSCAVQATPVTLLVTTTPISFTTPPALCNSSAKLNLVPYVNPAGGTFTGNGVVGNFLDPSKLPSGVDTITYTYVSGSGCTATATAYVTIQANPVVKITTTGPPTACYGSQILLSIAGGDHIQWYNNNVAIPGATGTTTYASSTGLYKAIVTSNGGCVGKDSLQVTIFPNQNLQITGSTGSICIGDTATLKSSLVGSSYKWTINHSFVSANTTNTYKTTTANLYTLTIKDANGCIDSTDFRVTVNPLPVVDSIQIGGDTVICKGSSVSFGVFNKAEYITYQWFKNGVAIPGATSNSYVATDSGTYYLQVTNSYGCKGKGRNLHVVIAPAPAAPHVVASSPASVCSPGFVVVSTSPVVPGLTYQWRLNGHALPNSNSSSYKAIGTGMYSVVVLNAKGCLAASDSVKVTIYPKPSASVSHGPLTTCNGVPVPLTVNPSPTAGDTYQWYKNGVIAPGQTGSTYTTIGSGTYRYIITNTNGCRDTSDSVQVNIYPTAHPVIIADGATTFCNPGLVTLESTSTFASYQWYLSGVPIIGATNQSYDASASGSYSLAVVDVNGCSAISNSIPVIVNTQTVPLLSAGGPTTFCAGGSVVLTASASGSGGVFAWFVNGKSIPSSLISGNTYTATASGTYTVTYTNSNGCTASSLPLVVKVNPLPTPLISVTGLVHFCIGTPSTDTLHVIKPTTGNTYTWYQLDLVTKAPTQVSTGLNDSIYAIPPVLSSQGFYIVKETSAAGCPGFSDTVSINIYRPPVTSLTNLRVCQGDTALLYSPPGVNFQWYYAASRLGPYVPAHTLPALSTLPDNQKTYKAVDSGYYYVSLQDGFGCTGTSDTLHVVWKNPITASVNPPSISYCVGTVTNLTATVSYPAPDLTGLTYRYQWYFMKSGGTKFDSIPGGIFSQVGADSAGTYKVVVSSKTGNNCPTFATATTLINTPVKPKLSVSPKDTLCAGSTDTLRIANQAALISAPGSLSYAWYRNKVLYLGHTADTLHTSTDGLYYVIVTDGNGCPKPSDSVSLVTVSIPKPTISTTGPTRFCRGGSDSLYVSSIGSYSYQWYRKLTASGAYSPFPGGTVSRIKVIDSGYYKVVVTNSSGCSGIDSLQIRVDSIPTISLPSTLSLCPGTAQTLKVKTAAYVQWAFNSPANVISSADSIQANLPGTYYVTAKNTANAKCYTLDSVKVSLYIAPVIDFYTASNCQSSDTVSFPNNSTIKDGTALSYVWDFGDPASGLSDTSSAMTGKHVYTKVGKYTVKLRGLSIHGCSDSAVHTFNFLGTAPKSKFTIQGSGAHCSGTKVSLRDTSTIQVGKILHYHWDFFTPAGKSAPVSADTTADIQVLFPDSSQNVIYRVRETVTAASGCSDTSSQLITITGFPAITYHNPQPLICLAAAPDTLRGGSPATGSYGGVGAYSGAGVVGGVFYPMVAGVGKHAITYTFINPTTGCNGQATDTIQVLSPPTGISLTLPSAINPCDSLVVLKAQGTGIKSYEWYVNGKLIPGATTASYTADSGGKYTARLFNAAGCYTDTSVTFKLNPHPRAGFTVSSICQNLTVYFRNLSTISDKSAMTYQWNFGDPSSAQNTSTAPQPNHLYTSAGNKTVTLIATSLTGCHDTLQNTLFVQAVDSTANFIIVANKPYCLYESLVFEDSSILSGKVIQQYTWKFFNAAGTLIKQDTGAVVQERFTLSGNLPETFTAQEFLNTGDSCLTLTPAKKFTINPNTPVTYVREAPRDLCIYTPAFNLTGGSTVPPGQPGTGYYSGAGVVGGNTFDPKIGGVGEDQVSYVFTNQYGCISSASVDYQVNDTIALTGSTIKANENAVVTLNGIGALPFTFGPDGITSITADSLKWYWSPATGLSSTTVPNPTFTATQNITYTLTLTSPKGCVSRTAFVVNVALTLFVPNAFTPNGDGIHDTWHIKGIDQFPNAEIFIFNRWGEQLFYSKGYGTEFNGYYNGRPLPAGTYYYLIKFNRDGNSAPQTGPLTIIY